MSIIKEKKKIFIGTSGWMYDHWKGNFYPKNLSKDKMLKYYSTQFRTVEINNTFYKLPKKNTVINWYQKSEDNFLFSVKANRYITHMKNLKDCEEPISNSLKKIKNLKEKLGPILFQLPPQWHKNYSRLKNFLDVLNEDFLYVIELRHPSWFTEEIFQLLRDKNVSLCIHDITGDFTPQKITADFIYIRFHGPEGNYHKKYSNNEISIWTEKIFKWYNENITIFVYFNNDAYGRSTENASEMVKELKNKYSINI